MRLKIIFIFVSQLIFTISVAQSAENPKADLGSSYEAYRKECETGDILSCYNQGVLDLQGGNKTSAKQLFKKACDGGELTACNNLAFFESQAGNETEARRLMKKACEGGEMKGCDNLATQEARIGNKEEARRLWKKACDGGEMGGCNRLGDHEFALGNRPTAQALWTKACDGGVPSSCSGLALFKLQGGSGAEAKVLAKRACDGGIMSGCTLLAELEFKAGNTAEGRRILKMECDSGDPLGCKRLADITKQEEQVLKEINFLGKWCAEYNSANGDGVMEDCIVFLRSEEKIEAIRWVVGRCLSCKDSASRELRLMADEITKKSSKDLKGVFDLLGIKARDGKLVEPGNSPDGSDITFKKKNEKSQIRPFLKKCKASDLVSCLNLGLIEYALSDLKSSKKHLKQSCSGGFQEACSTLEKLKW